MSHHALYLECDVSKHFYVIGIHVENSFGFGFDKKSIKKGLRGETLHLSIQLLFHLCLCLCFQALILVSCFFLFPCSHICLICVSVSVSKLSYLSHLCLCFLALIFVSSLSLFPKSSGFLSRHLAAVGLWRAAAFCQMFAHPPYFACIIYIV